MASTGIEDSQKTRSIIERLVCEKVLPELVTRAHANDATNDVDDGGSPDAPLHEAKSFQVAEPAPVRLGVLDQLRLKYEHLTELAIARRPVMRPTFWWQSDWPKSNHPSLAPPPASESVQRLPYTRHERSTAT